MVSGSTWQLQEAKARFSELVRRAGSLGPQVVTVHGVTAAIILGPADYDRLVCGPPGGMATPFGNTLAEVLRNAPKLYTDAEIEEYFGRSPDLADRDPFEAFDDSVD
jgi:prevent-host-death family protein